MKLLSLIALLLCVTLASCDKKKTITQPGTPGPLAAITSIWPNADGEGWTYRVTHAFLADTTSWYIFANPLSVPPAPSLSTLLAKFPSIDPLPSQFTVSDTFKYGLHFAGMKTTFSGAVGQNLEETFDIFPAPAFAAAGVSRNPLLAQLWQARPDLRPRIAARFSRPASAAVMSYPPLFLYGYCWKRTADAIVGLGDLDTLPAWRYLQAPIAPGAEFSQQLVAQLAGDVKLNARVLGRQLVRTPAGAFADAIIVFYEVDYGISTLTDQSGTLLGNARDISFGKVAYVDHLGPVASTERTLVHVGANGRIGLGYSWNGLGLISHELPPVPVQR